MNAKDIAAFRQTYGANQQVIIWYTGAIKVAADKPGQETYIAYLKLRIRQMRAENRWIKAHVPCISD